MSRPSLCSVTFADSLSSRAVVSSPPSSPSSSAPTRRLALRRSAWVPVRSFPPVSTRSSSLTLRFSSYRRRQGHSYRQGVDCIFDSVLQYSLSWLRPLASRERRVLPFLPASSRMSRTASCFSLHCTSLAPRKNPLGLKKSGPHRDTLRHGIRPPAESSGVVFRLIVALVVDAASLVGQHSTMTAATYKAAGDAASPACAAAARPPLFSRLFRRRRQGEEDLAEDKTVVGEEHLSKRDFGFLPIPRRCRYSPDRPFIFTRSLNWLFAFGATIEVANVYYVQPIQVQLSQRYGVSYETVTRILSLVQAGYLVGCVPLGLLSARKS